MDVSRLVKCYGIHLSREEGVAGLELSSTPKREEILVIVERKQEIIEYLREKAKESAGIKGVLQSEEASSKRSVAIVRSDVFETCVLCCVEKETSGEYRVERVISERNIESPLREPDVISKDRTQLVWVLSTDEVKHIIAVQAKERERIKKRFQSSSCTSCKEGYLEKKESFSKRCGDAFLEIARKKREARQTGKPVFILDFKERGSAKKRYVLPDGTYRDEV